MSPQELQLMAHYQLFTCLKAALLTVTLAFPICYQSQFTALLRDRERDDSRGALPEDVEALLAFGLDLWSRLVATSELHRRSFLQNGQARFIQNLVTSPFGGGYERYLFSKFCLSLVRVKEPSSIRL